MRRALDDYTDDELAAAARAFDYQATRTTSADRIARYQKRAARFRAELARRQQNRDMSAR